MSESIERVLAKKGSDVLTVAPDDSVGEAVRRLADRNVGAVVVLDGGSVVGVMSERDVVRRLAVDHDVLGLPVRDVMTSPVTTCTSSSTTDELARTMTDGRFRHVPVVDDDQLVGIVSIGDVVKRRLDELEMQTEQLTGYVSGTY
ncbi:MAG: CBS domain-containing protein [Nitriliruptor sp.]|uniref:CBS domain-containing protein n=1 Tax=Nitriliruptor sp. TaxID=2448056 RepID=UPI00349FF19A